MPIKVVWLSTIDLSNSKPNKSGTWIHSMYNALLETEEVKIVANLLFSNVQGVTATEVNGIKQFFLPSSFAKGYDIREDALDAIAYILESLSPDILHIWGTESCWCTIYKNKKFSNYRKLLEIQGLKFFWGKKSVFYAGLTETQILKMTGVLELLHPQMKIAKVRSSFEKWGYVEREILSVADHINTQSKWVRDIMSITAPFAQLHKTEIILRNSFLTVEPWDTSRTKSKHPVIFSTASVQPYKGVHVTLKAFSHVLQKYPDAELRIAGIGIKAPKYRNVGYVNYLLKIINELNIQGHVVFLGNLDEYKLISEMQHADVFVNSSFVESYCLALAEALAFGMPCVASYTSALTELIEDEKTGLFFPVGDDMVCASRIIRLLLDADLSNRISKNASEEFRAKINPKRIADQQVSIYKSML